jgi:hypothetical protein
MITVFPRPTVDTELVDLAWFAAFAVVLPEPVEVAPGILIFCPI